MVLADIKECTSCGAYLEETNYVVFPSPGDPKTKIARCDRCRKLKVKYKCPKSGFQGP